MQHAGEDVGNVVQRIADLRFHVGAFPQNLARSPQALDGGLDPSAARMTQLGVIVGTPAYMAPEQLSGESIDARADVFAFGVLMYEYAAGRYPVDAPGLAAHVMAKDVVPIAQRCPGLPATLGAVIDR